MDNGQQHKFGHSQLLKQSGMSSAQIRYIDPMKATENMDVAQLLLNFNKIRSEFFPEQYFLNGSWDILLVLYEARQNHKQMAIDTIGTETNMADSVTRRYLDILSKEDLVYQENENQDTHMSYAGLTKKAEYQIDEMFLRFRWLVAAQLNLTETV